MLSLKCKFMQQLEIICVEMQQIWDNIKPPQAFQQGEYFIDSLYKLSDEVLCCYGHSLLRLMGWETIYYPC